VVWKEFCFNLNTMQKNHLFRNMKLFSSKKSQINPNPGVVTRIATRVSSHVERHTADRGTYFLFLAFGIFLIDLATSIPTYFFGSFSLGPRYAGFEWVWGSDFINILTNITTSGIFGTFMLIYVIIKLARRDWETFAVETISFVLFAVVMTFFLLNNNWIGVPKALIHIVFILLFGFTFIRTNEDPTTTYFILTALLLIDFFLYNLVSELVVLRYIPFLLVFVIFYVYGKTQNGWSMFFAIILAITLMIFVFSDVRAQEGEFSFIAKTDAPSLGETKDAFFSGLQNIQQSWQLSLRRQIQYAITGKVEENQYEALGVYLDDVKAAQSKFYTDEDVVIWGIVRARTLDDPINIKVGCFEGDREDNKFANLVHPDKKFTVFTLEEQDFACTFRPKTFASGSKTITTFADFNFETLAFLKVYFMDRERLRAMTRQNQDPFDEFNIKDKTPKSVYTNGPVEIGIETTSPLIGVSENYLALPRLRLSIQNRPEWQGKIKALNELILLFPKGVELSDPANDCVNRKFELYKVETCKEKSCEEFVKNQCLEVCKGYGEGTNEFNTCKEICDDEHDQCLEECDFLFQGEGEDYLGYSLAQEEKEEINKKLEEGGFFDQADMSFSCRFNARPKEVLGNSPLTTKSLRVKVRYNYSVEKPISVRIDKVPELDEGREDAIGGRSYTAGTASEQKIIQIAQQIGFSNTRLAVAIAQTESTLNHCKDGSTECGTFKQGNVNCNSAGSCGIMQINRKTKAHSDLFDSSDPKGRLAKFGCLGETAYDLDCNIKSGIGILQGYINQYANDDAEYERGLNTEDACGGAKTSQEFKDKYLEKYRNYKGINRAIRAYNGLGCVPPDADVDYVENVNRILGKIESGSLEDKTVAPPRNLRVFVIDNQIHLFWDLSLDDGTGANDVRWYSILRKDKNGNYKRIINLDPQTTEFTDKVSIVGDFEYTYYVEAIDNNNNPAESEKKTISKQLINQIIT